MADRIVYKSMPNDKRAVCNAKMATIKDGKRIVRTYRSGEPLIGEVPTNDDAPPFTGYVRGWFKKSKK